MNTKPAAVDTSAEAVEQYVARMEVEMVEYHLCDDLKLLLRALLSGRDRLQRELDAERANERRAFELGWRTAANWMERDDLHADIGSPCYIADREAAIAAQEGK